MKCSEEDLNIEKLTAEIEKLLLEVGGFRKPWYWNPPYMQALVPLLLAALAFLAALFSGWFSTERIRLARETNQLQKDTKEARAHYTVLSHDVELLKLKNELSREK